MIENIIPLIGSFLPFWTKYLLPILALAILATIPCLIRQVLRWR